MQRPCKDVASEESITIATYMGSGGRGCFLFVCSGTVECSGYWPRALNITTWDGFVIVLQGMADISPMGFGAGKLYGVLEAEAV